ncbi:MAG: HlyC/CorC family transporter [Alphaproteobacteria bacterium]|jgi:CBS domain containing-hemolysin-like protein|nr:HlyC/CorC family transporter [Alphaproteobacteria bacterium]
MSEQDRPSDPDVTESDGDEASFVSSIADWLRRGFARGGEATWQKTVEEFIDEDDDVADRISAEERSLLLNLLRFGALSVEEAMLPRSDIVALPLGAPLDDVIAILKKAGHSRMPVFRGTLDDVAGMVHVRDVMAYWGDEQHFKLSEIMREILFVPPSMPVVKLLGKMRQTRLHMAVVVDEYGGTDGLVTIEDLVEEIVGEIEDEHDEAATPIVERADGTFDVEARALIDEVEASLGVTLGGSEELEDIETLGGLVTSLAGRVPGRGETVHHPAGVDILVLDADPRRVKRLRLRRVIPAGEGPAV